MSLRHVSGEQAGPAAVGILLPPGARTVLIVRPRALSWDLLLVQGLAGTTFRELAAEEAAAVAHEFYRALEAWNCDGPGQVAAVAADGGGYLVWADVGDFALVVCERLPGQPYRPAVFTAEEARQAAALVGAVLRPTPPAQQEVYFNTRYFAR